MNSSLYNATTEQLVAMLPLIPCACRSVGRSLPWNLSFGVNNQATNNAFVSCAALGRQKSAHSPAQPLAAVVVVSHPVVLE